MYDFETPVTKIKGVGQRLAPGLKHLGIRTIGDLLWYVPSGYADFRKQVTVRDAPMDTPITLTGTLVSAQSRRSWNRRSLVVTEAVLTDETGSIAVVWFGRFPMKIPTGTPVHLTGTIEYVRGRRQVSTPAIERVGDNRRAGKFLPVYALTAGVTQDRLRSMVRDALENIWFEDYFPTDFLKRNKLTDLKSAFAGIHAPKDPDEAAEARRRLAFDELFFLSLTRTLSRRAREHRHAPVVEDYSKEVIVSLPFPLTKDQIQAVDDISRDLHKGSPMARLLQGDVGSGKTAVAAVAASMTAKSGFQTLYLAPTDVLARQQDEALLRLLETAKVRIALLTRTAARIAGQESTPSEVRVALANHEVDIVVGTHALIQSSVAMANLGLVVVDEQHRFGVAQRMEALKKGSTSKKKKAEPVPHLLSMTATPIPRTLQLAFMGDLDVSTLHAMPHGERQVKTFLFGPTDRRRVEVAMLKRISKGEQIFVICPLIDPSDFLGVKSATLEYERLRNEAFKKARVGLLHGKLTSEEKDRVLTAFRKHELDMLVATTVIEVGIDVPEATVMVIEGAERFGLAQLHQLRGRVGRAGQEGVCVLFTENASVDAKKRLEMFTKITDGFKLAELDLKLRGPGEWFGTRQSGYEEFRVADLRDVGLLRDAKAAAEEWLRKDPEFETNQVLKDRVKVILKNQQGAS